MGKPAAKQGDQITAIDIHIVLVPAPPSPPVPTPLPHPFAGIINGNCSTNVNISNMPAATMGSTANNQPPHIPTPPAPLVPDSAHQPGHHHAAAAAPS
jgi:hypothetical protein